MRKLWTLALAFATAVLTAVGLVSFAAPASAATGDVGHLDQSYSGATNPPTSDKPQSKLWYTDGLWFADMFDTVSKTWHIFRLDRSTETWSDTGVLIDSRANTLADTLWDGSHLYVASHVATISTDTSVVPSTSNSPAYLYRFSYDSANKTFLPDSGFPSTITDQSSESMTIDEDSTGTIWATWTQVAGDSTSGFTNTAYANATTGSDATWGTPFVLPSGTGLSPDDISAVVAFGKNKIGVMWSNQVDESVYWAVHNDGAATTDWQVAPAIRGNKSADDHMNLKAIQADPSGRVFAAVKTSVDKSSTAAPTSPLILLLVFKPGTGSWSSTTFGTLADCHTRPQVVLDEEHQIVHVIASGPVDAGCTDNTGAIYEKSAPMDNPVFPDGRGTMILRDASGVGAAGQYMNNATTTKQSVNGTSGLVVLASVAATKRYWHADMPLGALGSGVPSTPAGLKATAPTSGEVDLSWTASTDDVGVTGYRIYRNGSTTPLGSVDGATLAYADTTVAASTSYSYEVTSIDGAGNESPKAVAYITTPSVAGSTTSTFGPTDDATVDSSNPNSTFGSTDRITVDGSPATDLLLKFDVSGTATCSVTNATLRLTVGSTTSDDSVYGGDVYGVSDSTWSESTVTWNKKPAAGTTKIGSIATAVALNKSYTVDVTPLVKGDGKVSMMMSSADANAAKYRSKEAGTFAPQLSVTCTGAPPDRTAPSNPGSLTATASSSSQVDLSWAASTDDTAVTGYRIYRNGSATPLASVDTTTLAFSDTTVAASTSYSYQVTAIDAAGNESTPSTAYITTPSVAGSTTSTFGPTDDATIDSANPDLNYGSSDRVAVDGSPVTDVLLKFDVSGTSTCTVTNATLTLTVGGGLNDESLYGGDVYGVSDNTWSESAVTWNTRPTAGTTKVGSIASAVALNTSYTVDVTSLVKDDGKVSMLMSSANSDAARYRSKEAGPLAPQLSVTCTGAPPDRTAPSTPGSLTATASSSSQVNLSWAASTDAVGVTGYRIFRNGSSTPLATVGGATLSYSDKTAAASTSYTYQVTAVDAAGNQSAPASTSVTTPAPPDTTAPSKPGGLKATAASSSQVNLSWTASTDAVGVTGYRVYRNGSTTPLASVSGSTLSYSDTTVAASTAYTYQVSAVDAAGNQSAKASASVTTPAPPDTTAPTVPGSLKATVPNSGQVNLSWTASKDDVAVTGYLIYRNGSTTALGSVTGSTLSYTDKTAAANTTYTYQVSAVDAAGNQSAKASVSVTTPPGKK